MNKRHSDYPSLEEREAIERAARQARVLFIAELVASAIHRLGRLAARIGAHGAGKRRATPLSASR